MTVTAEEKLQQNDKAHSSTWSSEVNSDQMQDI